MFDIGFSEIFVIAIVALLVLGPERLPKAARFAGLWVRRARAQWHSVKSELENELAAEELKRSLRQTQDSLREAQDELREGFDEARNRIKREQESLQRELDDLDRDVRDTAAPPPGSQPDASPARKPELDELPLASASDPDLKPGLESAGAAASPDDVYARGLPVETDSEAQPEPVPAHRTAHDDGAQRR
ncbi:Sec-independent protein translocase protein TatB [Lysobacter changpingensis]|uniref:Sec-independent protein translocase protein TatB n=1 Tax=Lysobacter changpingensis TaxID=2792784 RepID=UPI001A8DD7CA|nr:Sec-independent protein translocase protein TatB [Lysobacter changpingensis]